MEADPEPNLLSLTVLLVNQTQGGIGYGILSMGIVLVLLVLSGLFSGSENAFFSLGPSEINNLEESENDNDSKIISLIEYPDRKTAGQRLLATILIANNFVNIAIVILSSIGLNLLIQIPLPAWAHFILEVVIITFLLVLFGEIIPKIYATQNNIKLARLMAGPLFYLKKMLYLFSEPLVKGTLFLDKHVEKNPGSVSIEDLNQAIDIATEEDPIEEKNILKGLINFGNISVKQIMKARTEVISLEEKTPFSEVIQQAEEWGYSRIPVYKESFDNITGILYIKDLIAHLNDDESFEWNHLVRTALFVPEYKKIDDLLSEFKERHIHMAIVVDEYGGSEGIVTMEDILEEIFGDIKDEFDDEELVYSRLDDQTYLFEGKVQLTDLCRMFELENDYFDEGRGDSDSLGGMLMEISESIPQLGEEITYKNFSFEVEAADRRRVLRVKVIYTPEIEETENDEERE